jgi:phage terminase large subunit GpA-like protein
MRHGFPIRYYKKLRERNESLDLRVYNLAALEILNPNMERIMENLQVTEGDEVAEDQPQTVKNAPKRKPPRSGFATSWK